MIFEIPSVLDDEVVCILSEFRSVESALKAVTDLNGRYLGDWVVKTYFYNLDKCRVLGVADLRARVIAMILT